MSGDTELQALIFKPGIYKDVTEYMAEGGWVDCDKMRFRNNTPEKIGGYVREVLEQARDPNNNLFTGVARDATSWNDLSFKKYLAVASHLKVELFTDGKIYDITPIRETVNLENAITTNGTPDVQITDINHNLVEGDYIFVVSQEYHVDNVTLDGQYRVVQVIDADNYIVTYTATATGSTSLSGGELEIQYLLENGYQSNGNLTGWGGGTWGTPGFMGQGWNRPRAGIGGVNLRQWSLDTWGEDLIANVRNGKIYHWDATDGPLERLAQIPNSPDRNLFILVSQPSRHLVAFGSEVYSSGVFDPLIIRWANQETLDGWEIDLDDTENTAGEYRLPKGNYIVCAVQTRSEIVVFTDTDIYSMRYVGGEDVFQFEPMGTNITILSQNSVVDVGGVLIWQGLDNFYSYDGVVNTLPSTLDKYIFDQDGQGKINFAQKEKAYAGVNKEFNEIFFFYPAFDAEENDLYISYNYTEKVWAHGTMDRTVWVDRSTFSKPYALTPGGVLYVHETGKDADGVPMPAFIRSAYFDIGDGQDLLFIDRILPDVKLPPNRNMEITCYFKKYSHPAARVVTKGPYFFDDSKDKISLRGRGRQMSIEFKVTATGADFEIGKTRIGLQPDGGR